MKITSNTILKNDMPFVDMVLRNVEPFVDEMIITISIKSDDGTLEKVEDFALDFPSKVKLDFEAVTEPKELTQVRQHQLDISHSEWVMFLDGDDWWPKNRLSYVLSYLDNDIDGLAVSPYQVTDSEYYERQWTHMGFTKFFKKQPGVHYEGDWPRDLIYKDKEMLYWKTNTRVPMIPCMFYHLSKLKHHSFRNEDWAKGFEQKIGEKIRFNELNRKDIEDIYGCIRDNK
jgi:glycosyltransferase involved in cell wall biosynthesis